MPDWIQFTVNRTNATHPAFGYIPVQAGSDSPGQEYRFPIYLNEANCESNLFPFWIALDIIFPQHIGPSYFEHGFSFSDKRMLRRSFMKGQKKIPVLSRDLRN
jgi:hypothetical protein